MRFSSHFILEGSYKKSPLSSPDGAFERDVRIQVSVQVRRKKEIDPNRLAGNPVSHENLRDEFGAAEADIDLVREFASHYQLQVLGEDATTRIVKLEAAAHLMEKAFHVSLLKYTDSKGHVFRGRSGEVMIPVELKDVVTGVFGLDNREAARPMFQFARHKNIVFNQAAAPKSFTSDQLARIYGFPEGFTGKGQVVAIIELGGGYTDADLKTYFESLSIKPPAVKAVLVGGATNTPSDPNGADAEVMLDIEVAGAVAPDAHYAVYFGPNTDQGFLDTVNAAIHDQTNAPSIISLSWGSPEANFTAQSTAAFNESFKSAAALGITVCVASGDQGSSDGVGDGQVHVDFPASSPFVLACGGTKLSSDGNKVVSEVVWHESNTSAGGGGVSEIFPLPDYQTAAGVPVSLATGFKGRGVPDVAANADPVSGYRIRVDGRDAVIGGTSAVAPLMAGLFARVNEKNQKRAGFVNPVLYTSPVLCRDITEGDNKTTATGTGYSAGPGWDACTGLGVLSGLDITSPTVAASTTA